MTTAYRQGYHDALAAAEAVLRDNKWTDDTHAVRAALAFLDAALEATAPEGVRP